jgi:hypothetical protein
VLDAESMSFSSLGTPHRQTALWNRTQLCDFTNQAAARSAFSQTLEIGNGFDFLAGQPPIWVLLPPQNDHVVFGVELVREFS